MRKMGKLLAILLVIVVYGALMLVGDVKQLPPLGWVAGLSLLTLGGYFFRGLRWKILLNSQGMKIGMWQAVKTYVAGLAFIVTPGKMGEVVKAELMKDKFGFRRKGVAFLVVIERIMDVLGLGLIGLVGAAGVATGYLKHMFLVVAGLAGVGIVAYLFRRKIKWFESELEKIGDVKLIVVGLVLSVFAWGFEVCELLIVSHLMGFPLGVFQTMFIFTAALILGNLLMTPGGVGAAEAGMVGLLIGYGMDKSSASLATLTVRLTTFWFGFMLGAICWLLVSRQTPAGQVERDSK
ncbi:MAG TPA: flippase-like domain-containing protein [archaeon]|nr:flippase-like domain-containing protein [archaeon]